MRTISINVSDRLAGFIEAEVRRGAYASPSDVVEDGLDLLRETAAADEAKLEVLRREIQLGLDDAEAGRFSDRTVREIAMAVIADMEGET